MSIEIPEFEYKGIKRIEIPKTDDDFIDYKLAWSIIKKYLPKCMSTHRCNATKIEFLYNYFLGVQDILNKKRPYNKDKDNNNIIIENHANRVVNFKVGFLTGEPRDYTAKTGTNSDDLTYLTRYMTDCNFFPKDKSVKEWIYATGIGTSYVNIRTDIIVKEINKRGEVISRFKTIDEGFDIDFNTPFEYETVSPIDNFVVYSSGFGKEPLFCVSITDIDVSKDNEEPEMRKSLRIESRYGTYTLQSDTNFSTYYFDEEDAPVIKMPKVINILPIIEQSVNSYRMGIIELNREIFNEINTLKSAIADMIVDNSNAILVFTNTDVDSKTVEDMKKAGALIIGGQGDGTTNQKADVKQLTIEIPFEGLNNFYDQTLQQAYDIAGVPLASGQVTSGGDTGQARLLGGGWNNAYIVIQNDITTLKGYDYEILKTILTICHNIEGCKLDKLYASQIDINYRVNQNDNFLVKTQGMSNLYNMGMPLDFILKAGKLSNDIKTDEINWLKRLEELRKQEQTISKNSNNNDNNSQE